MWDTLAALALAAAPPVQSETLTNDSILTLVQAGVGETAVIAKIERARNRFVVDTATIVSLKRHGVPDGIIAAMIAAADGAERAPAAQGLASRNADRAHEPGLYLVAEPLRSADMIRLVSGMASQTKSSGILGYTLTGGLASLKMKSIVPGRTASVRVRSPMPQFYFYGDAASVVVGESAKTSPAGQFSLVRFEVKADRREARVGSFNISGTKTGVPARNRIEVDWKEVEPGIYRAILRTPLSPGEYGFLSTMRASSGVGLLAAGGIATRVFDFAIVGADVP